VIPMMVVPTLTRHDLLDRMLRSVDSRIGHLVVIDNSGRGIVGGDGPWERMTVLPMPTNLGVAASWNLAIRLAHREPWVLICSDDMWWPVNALHEFAGQSSEDSLVVSATWPHWCAFSIGMRVVQKVGLFDEGYFPAYFEDTEYERRLRRAGVERRMGPAVHHSNASTLNTPGSDFTNRNGHTYQQNRALFEQDRHHGFDPFRWREQAWT
jgi:GT2 family glycosyltransferase